ncbi:carbon monoxide dehydrogenase subunit G [Luteococcus japonicus]|uniref:Carbon monoxide dehydrogenase subunit G n=1 Tax=Luteococcus japonicus TaxID=33984 RepID=A0A3N1ZPW2_9ACTN|nr:carbon monoxide dehydrogenase subunit G [Luteococcus japonicus]
MPGGQSNGWYRREVTPSQGNIKSFTPRASFEVTLDSRLTPTELWDRLWDLDRHTAAVPLTRVGSSDGSPLREGHRFVARTQLGPVWFDDRMVVETWQPPLVAVVEKTGPILTGTIRARVEAAGLGSRLHWEQEFGARGIPNALAALARGPVASGYARVLQRILG